MKRKLIVITLAALVLTIGLTACAPGAATSEPSSMPVAPVEAQPVPTATPADLPGEMTAKPAVPTEQPQAAPTPTVDVYALILEKLDGHHSVDRVLNAQKTREEWNTTLDRMIGYGAKINEEEKQLIIDYLINRQ